MGTNLDMNEVYLLFAIAEKLVAHGAAYSYIRKAVGDRLAEIDAELNPNPPPPVEEPKPEEAPAEEEEEPADAA